MRYEEITSKDNALLKQTAALRQGKYRREYGRFAVEGLRLCEEAVAAASPCHVLFTEQLGQSERGAALLESAAAKGAMLYRVPEHLLAAAADTVNPQGVICVLPLLELPLPEKTDGAFYLLCDALADPGNMGAVLRLAYAVGADGVLLLPDCVDVYNPKVVRASMGGVFRVPCARLTHEEAEAFLRRLGVEAVLADAAAAQPYWKHDFRRPTALLLGNEANGISAFWRERGTAAVSIPMPGGAESLNVAVSAGILCYEALRQRSV